MPLNDVDHTPYGPTKVDFVSRRRREPITLDKAWENFLESCENMVITHWEAMEEQGIDVSKFAKDVNELRRRYLIEQTARLR